MFKITQHLKFYLQKYFGFEKYLYISSILKYKFILYDKRETDIFHFINLIPSNSVILDIGANVGVMTRLFSLKKPDSFIYSFEPIPQNSANIEKIIKQFNIKNVKLYKTALGNSKGSLRMVMPIKNGVLYEGLTHVIDNENEVGEKFEVDVMTLDEIMANQLDKITAIKIDVENHEYEVFKGAKDLLTQSKPVIYCELMNNENRNKVMDLLYNFGYQSYVIEKNKLTLTQSLNSISKNLNFIFIHNTFNGIRK